MVVSDKSATSTNSTASESLRSLSIRFDRKKPSFDWTLSGMESQSRWFDAVLCALGVLDGPLRWAVMLEFLMLNVVEIDTACDRGEAP
jgi:hypothetical protein